MQPCPTAPCSAYFCGGEGAEKNLRNLVKSAEFHQDAFEERAYFSTKICLVLENVKLCGWRSGWRFLY